MSDDYTRALGCHIRSLRHARNLTQETLAELSELSTDTVRRLEHGSFTPTVGSLRKLCTGLNLQVSTLFESFESGRPNIPRELLDLVADRSPSELARLARIMRFLLEECGPVAGEDDDAVG